MARIHSDITTAFGDTPLVRLNALTEGLGGEVLAKLEFYNPGSSVKDRLGVALVDGRRGVRRAAARRHDRRVHERQHRHRARAHRRGPRLQGDPHDARVDVEGAPDAAEGLRRRTRAHRPVQGHDGGRRDRQAHRRRDARRGARPPVRAPGQCRDPPPHDGGGDLARHRRPRRLVRRGLGHGRHDHGRRAGAQGAQPRRQDRPRRAEGLPRADGGPRRRPPDPGHRPELRARRARPLASSTRSSTSSSTTRSGWRASSPPARASSPGCRRARPCGRRCRSPRVPRPRVSGSS